MVAFFPRHIGRYELIEHLASGGMGQVYLARATGLGGFERRVVIKVLQPTADDDPQMVAMFIDEARLVGALHHHCIAPVFEVGCDDEGRFFFVMDYLPGENAAVVFRACEERTRPVPLPLALGIGSSVASALAYAHAAQGPDGRSRQLVHRDVSPSNIIVGYDGSVRLIDFGIAKTAHRAVVTQAGAMKGKLGYLAPEQVLHASVDRRTDIFALGVVLYELTTGTRAFHDASDLITFERILRGELDAPSTVLPGFPAELERIILQAVALSPADRYPDAASLAADLDAFARAYLVPVGPSVNAAVMGELFRGPPRIRLGSDSGLTGFTIDTDADAASTDLGIPVHIHSEVTPVNEIVADFEQGSRTDRITFH
ncbi:MAG: serine/threonine protein kinase [Deltaproteobacteria bacterium]|nr:serine/threonine protein kinase [Deltaproteobacteria bacterium]